MLFRSTAVVSTNVGAQRLSWGSGEFLEAQPPAVDSTTVRAATTVGVFSFPRDALRRIAAPQGGVARLTDSFQALDPAWTVAGNPSLDASRRISPPTSLGLTKGGQALERKLPAPVAAGEVQLWVDDELTGGDARWTLTLRFGDKATVRIGRSGRGKVQASSTGEPKLKIGRAHV